MDIITHPPMQQDLRIGDPPFYDPLSYETAVDEHDLYPAHEEDSVPVYGRHFWQNNYMAYAIQLYRPDLSVTGDTCLYWERGNIFLYRAPDVAVIAGPAEEPPNVYLAWLDPPLLFVAEIGSRSTFLVDTGPKMAIYEQELKAAEYLYSNHKGRVLLLWRMVEGRYTPISPDSDGRIWSTQLGLGFGFDETGFLRIYTPAGVLLLTHEETAKARKEAEQRAQAFEQRAEISEQRAEISEQRAQAEAQAREEAEHRAQLSLAAQAEAERRLADMAAELERLRSQRNENR